MTIYASYASPGYYRDMERVGIPIMGYKFSLTGVWGRGAVFAVRGGAQSPGVHDPLRRRIPSDNKPPGTVHPTPPHQDNYYFCLEPPNVITMWIAMDKVDDENGFLRYMVGSHREGVRTHSDSDVLGFSQGVSDFGPDDEAREVAIHLQSGDLTVHHGEMIHRADPNRSITCSRRAFAMVVRGRSCRVNEQQRAVYLSARDAQHQAKRLQT